MDMTAFKRQYGKTILAVAGMIVTAALGALAQWLGTPTPEPVTVEKVVHVEKTVIKEADPAPMGWVNDPDEVAVVSASLPIKVFGDTPAGHIEDLPKFHYCWKHYEDLFARPPPIDDQKDVGSCVGFGTTKAVMRTHAGEIVRRKGSASEWSRFAEEATYGGSRVEIGGGRIRGDGSVGGWAAQFVTKYGMVPRKKYDTVDLTTYSTTLCREWGRSGVPDEFEVIARKFPVKSFVQVKVWEEAKAAIAQDYCIAVCSNQGFANRRDENGVARASGSWAHSMCIDGYHIEGSKEYGHIVNSWGTDWISGPTGWGNPGGDGFWAESSVIDRMLKQGDSWAFSGVTGFPARKPLDWNVNRVEPLKDLFTLRRSARQIVAPEAVLPW